jgi:hypothetical protein
MTITSARRRREFMATLRTVACTRQAAGVATAADLYRWAGQKFTCGPSARCDAGEPSWNAADALNAAWRRRCPIHEGGPDSLKISACRPEVLWRRRLSADQLTDIVG